MRRWVTLHGFSVNVAPDLSHFAGIVPCGLPDYAVTSVERLTGTGDMQALDTALAATVPELLQTLSCALQNEA